LDCYDLSISWAKKALTLQTNHTFDAYLNYYLSELYLNLGDISNARKFFNTSHEKDSRWNSVWYLGGRIETIAGNYKDAKQHFDEYLKDESNYPEYFYAFVLLKVNQTAKGQVILKDELKLYEKSFDTEKPAYNFDYIEFAEVYSILNEKDKAFEFWQKGIDENYIDIKRVKQYPYFENLKSDARYKVMLQKMQTKIDSYKNKIKLNHPEFELCN
jgi:tetratricopeptide (TPR) repeat protein